MLWSSAATRSSSPQRAMTTPEPVTPEVEAAVAELRDAFPKAVVAAVPDGGGGVEVTIDSVDLGPTYVQRETWVRFHIGFQYPHADVYPIFVRPDLKRVDVEPHPEGITHATVGGTEALQLSRRSNRLNPASDTAALKVAKVLHWMESR